MAVKATQDLQALFREKLDAARRSGEAQKLGMTSGVLLRVCVQGRRVSLLVCRTSRCLDIADLVVIRGQCGVPRHAVRRPAVGQHQQEIDGRVYFAIEYSWGI